MAQASAVKTEGNLCLIVNPNSGEKIAAPITAESVSILELSV